MRNHDVVLEVNNISKVYKGDSYEVQALKSVSFEILSGELIAIMGTSGSGKSTLLNIIAALDKPDKGSLRLNGNKIDNIYTEPQATNFRRENIGFIFQSFNLLKDLTVEENISIPLILKNVSQPIIKEKVEKVLELVGLKSWRKHRPVQLSGGQQQRVAIGRAIISEQPIILADEPTGNLDFNTSTEILKILVEMKEKLNQSILLVTHDPSVATYAERVLFFHDGEIIDEYCCRGKDDLNYIVNIFKTISEGRKG